MSEHDIPMHVHGYDLAERGRILYASSVDVSEPNGPGVNEREFLGSLLRHLGERAHAILPKPRFALDDHPRQERVTWVKPLNRRDPRSMLAHKMALVSAIQSYVARHKVDLVVLRLDVVPLEVTRLMARGNPPYAVKTLGASFATPPGGHDLVSTLRRAAWRGLAELHEAVTRRVVRGAVAVDACTPELCKRAINVLGADPRGVHLVENAAWD